MKERIKNAVCLVLVVLLSITMFVSCEKKQEVFKIGFCGALTGNSAIAGKAVVNAIETALREINEQGGINGMKVEFVYRDDESDATKNLTGVEELLYKEKVDLMFGAVNSGSCSASLAMVCEAKIPELITDATSASLIDEQKYPFVFRNVLTNDIQAESLVKLAKEGDFKRIVVIGDTTDLGQDGFKNTREFAKQYNLEIVEYIPYTANDADLTAVAQSINNAKADCVIAWSYAADAAKIVKALDRIDILKRLKIYGYSGFVTTKFNEMVAGIDCSNIYCVSGLSGFVLEPNANKLEGKFQNYYNKLTNLYGEYKLDGSGRTTTITRFMRAYDSVYMIKWLIEEKTKSKDGTAIKEAIEKYGSDYDSLWSNHSYMYSVDNHEGFNVNDACMIITAPPLVNEYVQGDISQKK